MSRGHWPPFLDETLDELLGVGLEDPVDLIEQVVDVVGLAGRGGRTKLGQVVRPVVATVTFDLLLAGHRSPPASVTTAIGRRHHRA